ncbi:hypothetical protein [Mitsuaria sp. 7]|uniref:hypothetical protein n=1 Tax=Mitsuaria sp. 7 TaxID=1658665 RepID=UPI0007DDD2FA|nr:hypothetical protein [Mitsuaria sp. 7]ANH67066.1 hypothetical protein ABE85_04860 [Mitsuaria sp. 7]
MGLLIGLVGLAAGLLLDFKSADWAAWVQAVGSIAAILVAIEVTSLQHEKALQAKRDDEATGIESRSQLLFSIAAEATSAVGQQQVDGITTQDWLESDAERSDRISVSDRRVKALRAAVHELQLGQLRAKEIVVLIEARDIIDRIAEHILSLQGPNPFTRPLLVRRAEELHGLALRLQVLASCVRDGLA